MKINLHFDTQRLLKILSALILFIYCLGTLLLPASQRDNSGSAYITIAILASLASWLLYSGLAHLH
jgi:hypothetical protein